MTEIDYKKLLVNSDEYQIADVSFAPIQMGDIYFYQRDKPKLKYNPSGDITPYETSLLLPLFTIGNRGSLGGCHYDFHRYIYMNGLIRHFEEVE